LRCGKLSFEPLSRIPHPDEDPESPSLWLVLDEVVDPQNLGALLRSAHFLGAGNMGVLVCAKNSAPPSPVVSASSAGALELLTVYSTSNLPRTLNNAQSDGFRIVGASSSVPRGNDDEEAPPLYELQDLPTKGDGDNRPVLLVLGSEGYGLRTLVSKACTEFVRVPGGLEESDEGSSAAGVDSLNVSVSGGILLWHLLHGGKK
jgi:21S rRNA (GM2251-2'-O)-methyltransferase